MKPAHLAIHRKNTLAFIAERPSEIILTPRSYVETSGGGHKWEVGAPRTAQTFRIIEIGTPVTPPVLQLTNGQERVAEYQMLGAHDAVAEKGDFWTEGEDDDVRTWEVGEVARDNEYETRILVAERGE